MSKTREALKNQAKVLELKQDADDCLKLYNAILDNTGGVSSFLWNELVTTYFVNGVRRYQVKDSTYSLFTQFIEG